MVDGAVWSESDAVAGAVIADDDGGYCGDFARTGAAGDDFAADQMDLCCVVSGEHAYTLVPMGRNQQGSSYT